MPLFSVIVPTYHRNDLLRVCLTALSPSVQTLPAQEYEVIVTDDGKNTTAEAMIRSDFPWVRWVAGPQKGPASNRNFGAKQAHGEWLIFTDDDCVPTPGFVAGYQSALQEGVTVYEGKTTCSEGIHSPLFISPVNLEGGCFWSCNIMLHRSLFAQMDGFDESFAVANNEDTDLRERLRHSGKVIRFVPQALVDHPPRLRKLGIQAGRQHETVVQMWYKTGNHSAAKISVKLLRMVASENLTWARKYPLGKNTVSSLGYGVAELAYVAAHLPKWSRKYRNRFVDETPAYPYPY